MSDPNPFGFGRFVPGFDFLQNLARGAGQGLPQMPNLANWVAPTLSVEELEKRIGELKAVHFWLDQNGKALAATIQALEVQKMTLATLQGMNLNLAEVASALQAKPAPAATPAPAPVDAGATNADAAGQARKPAGKAAARSAAAGASAGAAVDPLQWWGALTQQFQQIAANAMQDVAQQAAKAPPAAGGGAAPAPAARARKTTAGARKTAPRKPRAS